jgi:hypothetical protein
MEVGDCVDCGKKSSASEGGALRNVTVTKGMMRGDNVCVDCLTMTALPQELEFMHVFLDRRTK